MSLRRLLRRAQVASVAAEPPKPDEVLRESNGSQLVRKGDGSLVCMCRFLCAATYEKCEFEINNHD